jgi:hypothetical protein
MRLWLLPLLFVSRSAFADSHCVITDIHQPTSGSDRVHPTWIDVPGVYAKGPRWAEYNCRQDSRALASSWLYDHGGCLGSHIAFKYTVKLGERGYEKTIDLTIPCPKGGSAPSGGGGGGSSGSTPAPGDPVKCVIKQVRERDLGAKDTSIEVDWLKGQPYPDKIPPANQEILCRTQAMNPAIEWARANGLCGMNVKYRVELGRVSNPKSLEGGAICNPHKPLGH